MRISASRIKSQLNSFIFVQKQKLEETRLLKDFFTQFNERYSGLNEKLNEICRGNPSEALKYEDKDALFEYFNLCAEEYLFRKRGYILPEVWKAWTNGMKVFFDSQRIRDLWKEDSKTDSYYGFEPPVSSGPHKSKGNR